MSNNIFAWTEPTPPGGYPAYISINRDDAGKHTITIRSQGEGGRNAVTVQVTPEILESMLCDIAADLYRDDARGIDSTEGGETQSGSTAKPQERGREAELEGVWLPIGTAPTCTDVECYGYDGRRLIAWRGDDQWFSGATPVPEGAFSHWKALGPGPGDKE